MKFEIKQSHSGEEWNWHLIARNGKWLACELGFLSKRGALNAAKRVRGVNKWPIMQVGPYRHQNRRLA